MKSCILPQQRNTGFVKIKGQVEINKDSEKYTRVEIWDITSNEIKKMLSSYSAADLEASNKIGDQKIAPKLKQTLSRAREHASFVTPIIEKLFENADSGRHQSMALKQVLDTIEGEMNKAVNYDVDLADIQNSDGIPYIPAHRLAASIGRQVLYTRALRIHKANLDSDSKSRDVEHMYYLAGMTVLNQLQESGFITVHAENTGKSSIQDYLLENENRLKYDKIITESVPVVELNAAALGATKLGVNSKDEVLTQIRGLPGTTRPVRKTDTPLFGLKEALNAVSMTSVPLEMTFPFANPESVASYHPDDYTPTGSTAKVKKSLESKPTRFNKSIYSLFELMNKQIANSEDSASQWLKRNLFNQSLVEKMFKIEQGQFVDSDRASANGRNLAATTPLDDVVEYFDGLNDSMYMAMFAGRNTRLYIDNSVVNPHSSKFMRHALAVDEYEISIGNPAFDFFVDKVSMALGHSVATSADIKTAILDVKYDTKNPLAIQIREALEALKAFDSATTASDKIQKAQALYNNFEASDLAELITTLQAVQDIRNGLNSSNGVMKSTYMVSSDATASGGQLTLMQALGSNPERVSELLSKLGILKGNEGNPDLKDIYGILQSEINKFIGDKQQNSELFGSRFTEDDLENQGYNRNTKDMLKTIGTILFDGDWREMSKGPTMTFIYDQSAGGARDQLSKDFTERFLKKYKKKANQTELNKYLKSVGIDPKDKNDSEFKKELFNSFKASTVPDFLYDVLTHAITVQYLEQYKKQAADVYRLAESTGANNIKVFPAPLVVDIAKGRVKMEYTKENLEKYGVPISKIMEVARKVEGGDTVLTREEKLRPTVMNVSLIHSADTANLVMGLIDPNNGKALPDKFNSGVVVVHDDIRSRPDLVMEAEKNYIAANKDVGMFYDVHAEVMKAIAVYDNSLNSNPEYTKLNEQIKSVQATKQSILEDKNNGYNSETTAIIGDKPITEDGNTDLGQSSLQETVGTAQQTTSNAQSSTNENGTELLEQKRSELKNALDNTPDAVLTYDLETSGNNPSTDFVVQGAWKVGKGKTVVKNVQMTSRQAKKYIADMGKIETIANSQIYKDIKASYEADPSMAQWNANSISFYDLEQMLTQAVQTSPIVVTYNGTNFDDEFFDNGNIQTTHDMGRLAFNTTEDHSQKGRLTDFMDSKSAHNADADVDMTFELASMFANNKPLVNRASKLFFDVDGKTKTESDQEVQLTEVDNTLRYLALESEIIADFLASENRSSMVVKKDASFDPKTDTIALSPEFGDMSKAPSKQTLLDKAEHEIVHSYTVAMIVDYFRNGKKNLDLAYIEKAVNRLSSLDLNSLGIPDTIKARLNYIRTRGTPEEQVSEFMAVMIAEPFAARHIYKAIGQGNKLETILQRVITSVRKVIKRATKADVISDRVDAEQLYSSLNAVFFDGKNMRQNEFETFNKLQKDFGKPLGFGPETEQAPVGRTPTSIMDTFSHSIDNINAGVAKYTVQVAERQGVKLGSNLDKYMKVHLPAYRRVVRRANKFYDDSTTLQQIMHKITNTNIDQLKKNEILSLFQKISGDKNTITSNELKRFADATKGMSAKDVKAFEDFGSKMSMTDLFALYPTGIPDVEAEIERLSSDNFFTKNQIAQIDALVDFNVNDNFTRNTPYNLYEAGLGRGGIADNARRLMLMKSIQAMGTDRFNALSKNEALMEVARDNLLANAAIIARSPSLDASKLRDHGLVDEYKEPVVFKAVSLEEMKFYDNNSNWVVLRPASKEGPGVVYQKVIDSTYQSGVFTNIQMNSGDIDTSGRFKGKKGVATVAGEQKIILTKAEKIKAGLITNPAQTMVRTMTTNLAIQDSNVIREKLLQEDTYMDISTEAAQEKLVREIKGGVENGTAWYLNDINDRDFDKLHPAIKAKYMRIPTTVSNVDGFDERVKYVRKDISYWLTGAAEKSIASNRPLQHAIRVTKGLIAGAKIGMVILNPVKIAKDNVFNVVYMGTLGIDPIDTAKYYRDISTEFHQYQEIKDQLLSLRVRGYADGKKYDAQIAKLEKKLSEHPLNGVVKRGFINSLDSEIILHEESPGSGFKTDIDKALTAILKDNKGQNNALGKLIMRVAKTPGLSMEGLLEIWSKPFSKFGASKNIEAELLRMSERVTDIKSTDDVVAYMHQYLNSPDSEFVKLGTHMTDLTDIIAKEGYYRHLTQKMNMPPEQAEKEVLASFPDYKEALPTNIQKMDSIGVLMFSQYWMQMIKAMYRLTERRPASFGTEMLISEMMGTQSQLWSQTIFDQAFSNWGLVHNPANHIGVGSLVPTNVF